MGEWRLVEIDMGDGEDFVPSADAIPMLNFTAEANPTGSRILNGSGGCNRVMGGYDAGSTGRITFTNGPAMTMMACPEEIMAQEQQFLQALEGVGRHRLAEGRFELLFGDDGVLTFEATEIPEP